jgi:hypothetical protein
MPTYLLKAGGTGSWSGASATLTDALALATTDGDIIKVSDQHSEAVNADTTWTVGANIQILCVSDSDQTALATMDGSTYNIGGTGAYTRLFSANNKRVYFYGLAISNGGGANDAITLVSSAATSPDFTFDSCKFIFGTTSSSPEFTLSGISAAGNESMLRCVNCTFKFGNTAHSFICANFIELTNCSLDSSGSIPTVLFASGAKNASVRCIGCDWSHCTGTLVGDQTNGGGAFEFIQCKFGSGVTVLASQTTVPNLGGAHVYVYDSDSGDVHIDFGYYNALGYVVQELAYTATGGAEYDAAGSLVSWKIVPSANADVHPFRTPWLSVYHAGTSAITPYVEILRVGSATAFTDTEVWSEWGYKKDSGSTKAEIVSDRGPLAGTASAQADGMGKTSWNEGIGDPIDSGDTAWSGKLSPTASITPAEVGDISVRIAARYAGGITVYVDPQIRGLS